MLAMTSAYFAIIWAKAARQFGKSVFAFGLLGFAIALATLFLSLTLLYFLSRWIVFPLLPDNGSRIDLRIFQIPFLYGFFFLSSGFVFKIFKHRMSRKRKSEIDSIGQTENP